MVKQSWEFPGIPLIAAVQQGWSRRLLYRAVQGQQALAGLLQLVDLHVGLRQHHHLRQDVRHAQVVHLIPAAAARHA